MIDIKRDETRVVLVVNVFPIGYSFNFSYNAGSEWAAVALHKILREAFQERVQQIRKKEYEDGLRDAKKKKIERKDWFWPWLENK